MSLPDPRFGFFLRMQHGGDGAPSNVTSAHQLPLSFPFLCCHHDGNYLIKKGGEIIINTRPPIWEETLSRNIQWCSHGRSSAWMHPTPLNDFFRTLTGCWSYRLQDPSPEAQVMVFNLKFHHLHKTAIAHKTKLIFHPAFLLISDLLLFLFFWSF